MRPIRVLAGFEVEDSYVCPRTQVQPSEELLSSIWGFIEKGLDRCWQAQQEDDRARVTAVCFLRYFQMLRVCFFQDAAAMWILHPERRNHPMYKESVFKSAAWEVS